MYETAESSERMSNLREIVEKGDAEREEENAVSGEMTELL